MTKQNLLNENEFHKDGAIFMGANRNKKASKICIFGVPYDGTTSFRPGSRFGPSSIREVSHGIETYCPELNLDLNDINYTDLGSLEIPYGAPEPILKLVEKNIIKLIKNKIKPLMLGGEHSITPAAIKALYSYNPNLILVQLDAHADLRNKWLGNKNNHACSIRRCLDILPSNQVLQVGIRSGTLLEFNELKSENRSISFKSGEPPNSLKTALAEHFGKPIYVTIDLDWFDPSLLPGTGTPEPGGFFWQDFVEVMHILKKHELIGADIVELAPQLDPSGISSILAAKVTRSMLILLNN